MGNYQRLQDNECPRCGGFIPNDFEPGAYPGAMSRVDNITEICSECGVSEALEHFTFGKPSPMTSWANNR